MSDEEIKQLHINIPRSLHEKARRVMPEHGAITSLVRNFLINFISTIEEKQESLEESPFDKVVNNLADNYISKRSSR